MITAQPVVVGSNLQVRLTIQVMGHRISRPYYTLADYINILIQSLKKKKKNCQKAKSGPRASKAFDPQTHSIEAVIKMDDSEVVKHLRK